jgi:hypothetical protein
VSTGLFNKAEEVKLTAVSLAVLVLLGWSVPVRADDGPIAEWLQREIIGPSTAQQEVEAFTEARVPDLPEFATAREFESFARDTRQAVLERVVFRGQATQWRDATTRVEWLDTIDNGQSYVIKKLRYEALPGLWIPALLYEPKQLATKVPVVLNVNGHDPKGKAAPYKQIRCINQAKRGMIALNVEWLGMGQLRGDGFAHYRMNQLDLCGTSGLAPFYLSMKRCIDLLLAHPNADSQRVAVTGLSGGGWQTIIISSLDTRVTLTNPVAGYSSLKTRIHHHSDLGDSEQTPVDLATVADYTHLTALLAPRPALLTLNQTDNCCFAAPHALQPLLDAAQPVYRLVGHPDEFHHHVNFEPGTHNFERDNREALYRMFGQYFFAEQKDFSAEEIPSDDELLSGEQLDVELPEGNADFHVLALGLSRQLPDCPPLPADEGQTAAWKQQLKKRLQMVVRMPDDPLQTNAEEVDSLEDGTLRITTWKLHVGREWTVPAVEFVRGRTENAVILVADEGRKTMAAAVNAWLEKGYRVVAVDPFYLGESHIASRDFLFALLVSSVGQRPLGIQAGQLASIARWLRDQRQAKAVSVAAYGPRTSLISMVATAIEPEIAAARLQGSFASLKQIIETNGAVNQTPELFCFGLLQAIDIPQLVALSAPRTVEFAKSTD